MILLFDHSHGFEFAFHRMCFTTFTFGYLLAITCFIHAFNSGKMESRKYTEELVRIDEQLLSIDNEVKELKRKRTRLQERRDQVGAVTEM